MESNTTPENNWCGRHVKVLDGSTVSMPDTTDNQEAYPHLNNFIPELKDATPINRERLYQIMLKLIAHKLLPSRPARVEPRVRKRRPKSYPLMQRPRQLYNQQAA